MNISDRPLQSPSFSRRNLFKLATQIVSGAAIALVGFESLNSNNAWATVNPNYIPCPNYQDTMCLGKNTPECGNLYKLQVWQFTGGGIPNSSVCCPHTVVGNTFCSTGCDVPVTCH